MPGRYGTKSSRGRISLGSNSLSLPQGFPALLVVRTESNGHVRVRIVNFECGTSAARKEGIRKATAGRIGLIRRPAMGQAQPFSDRSAADGATGIGRQGACGLDSCGIREGSLEGDLEVSVVSPCGRLRNKTVAM